MKKFSNNQMFLIFLILIVLFILIIFGVNYFNKVSNASINDIDITYGVTGNSNSLSNSLPLSDNIGKEYTYDEDNIYIGYNTLKISSIVDYSLEYEVYLEKKESSNIIDDKYIKFYLSDNSNNALTGYDGNAVPTINDLSSDKDSNIVLYKKTLKAGSSDSIVVKSWLNEVYPFSNNKETFNYEIRVKVL